MVLRPDATTDLIEVLINVPKATEHRCPGCNSVIYSRRFTTCRDCGEELPASVRLEGRDQARMRADVERSRQRVDRLADGFGSQRSLGGLVIER